MKPRIGKPKQPPHLAPIARRLGKDKEVQFATREMIGRNDFLHKELCRVNGVKLLLFVSPAVSTVQSAR